jgi:hypothetical protein
LPWGEAVVTSAVVEVRKGMYLRAIVRAGRLRVGTGAFRFVAPLSSHRSSSQQHTPDRSALESRLTSVSVEIKHLFEQHAA